MNASPTVILAFDFGLKRIGCAIGNDLSKSARPLKIIRAEANDKRFAEIGELIVEWQPAKLVVGLPSHPDGTEHDMTRRCRRFANQLHGRFALDTILVDERYTSSVLNFKPGQADDAHAAALILQQYFDETLHN
ncbi:Holliday junction resolvase RuvX [Oxalobacter paraformigenes]|uniref:Putative pre-16S rRNA nuclease n=1 Tax=Oxalobacter paraformigenes TaxID=556268 RepID=C3X4H9_9BURK|nr:Holliday junction resolvase RuvX [Oxalobacter paraformigenes]EEO28115.1 RNAse H-fold protein YqgF [Oxalobacter paraformigenes]